MKRELRFISVHDVIGQFETIEFPEYQREPNVWNLNQKQRLVDSVFRQFDISAIYMYKTDAGALECIDGRQRLNTLASFLGANPTDDMNGFRCSIENEIIEDEDTSLQWLEGKRFSEIQDSSSSLLDSTREEQIESFLNYPLTMVVLRGVRSPAEFNLQFLRLNLGTLINAGEKLHAMVGEMRDRIFGRADSKGLGAHPFLQRAAIPTRRYAREQIAAQLVLQARSLQLSGEFARARHVDLQKLFKSEFEVGETSSEVIAVLSRVLDLLESQGDRWDGVLRNRAITVSFVMLAWRISMDGDDSWADDLADFADVFIARLAEKSQAMRDLDPTVQDSRTYLIDFQRHVTQAAVEKYAVEQRHQILQAQYEKFQRDGDIEA